MKKIICYLLFFVPCLAFAQIGIKAGLNFAYITSASAVNNNYRTGYHAGIFLGSPFHKVLGFRIEFGYSKQGYDLTSGSDQKNISLNYITSSQLLAVGITRYFQLQAGFQIGYLLNAKTDSSKNIAGLPGSYQKILDISNRLDYGLAAGIEIHPAAGLLIGARMNFSLSKLYNNSQPGSLSGFDFKSNVLQLSIGWRFGKPAVTSRGKA